VLLPHTFACGLGTSEAEARSRNPERSVRGISSVSRCRLRLSRRNSALVNGTDKSRPVALRELLKLLIESDDNPGCSIKNGLQNLFHSLLATIDFNRSATPIPQDCGVRFSRRYEIVGMSGDLLVRPRQPVDSCQFESKGGGYEYPRRRRGHFS
jgi:hypothetical protein